MTGINLYWKDFDNNWTNATRFSQGKNVTRSRLTLESVSTLTLLTLDWLIAVEEMQESGVILINSQFEEKSYGKGSNGKSRLITGYKYLAAQ